MLLEEAQELRGQSAVDSKRRHNMATDDLDPRIRERAYQIWLDEGQPDGKEREH